MGKNKEIIVDLRKLRIRDNVLDLCYKGKGVIYRALKDIEAESNKEAAVTSGRLYKKDDCGFIYGNPSDLPFEDDSFDTVTAFFSLSYIERKYKRNKTIKEIKRVLKDKGRLYIWDIKRGIFNFSYKQKIRAIIPDGESILMDTGQNIVDHAYSINTILPVVKWNFKIAYVKDLNEYFYIEAEKNI